MEFWDHIEELRKRFIRIIIVIIVLMIIVFSFKSFLFDTLLFGPLDPNFITYKFICQIFPKSGICTNPFYINLQNSHKLFYIPIINFNVYVFIKLFNQF